MKTGITLEEALAIVREHTAPLPPERRAGEALLGRVLAENITAPMDQPPFDRSPLHGHALASPNTQGAAGDWGQSARGSPRARSSRWTSPRSANSRLGSSTVPATGIT